MTAAAQIERIVREEYGRVLAALISQLGDFMLAEDALQDALVNVLERWEIGGVPVVVLHRQDGYLSRAARTLDNLLRPAE